MDEKLLEACRAAFESAGAAVTLGAPLEGHECCTEPLVRVPLAMMNRHGLIAGATGTGKTKTLQLMAEQLSAAGVPVFLADMKGDLSGLGAAGEADDARPSSARATPAGAGAPPPSRSSSSASRARAARSSAPPCRRSGRCCSPRCSA